MIEAVTHDGSFHADDVFGAATLRIAYDGRVNIVRSCDPTVIATADIVFDVGGVFDPETGRLDHHQPEGAGERNNGVPFSSFGLLWAMFGDEITGDGAIAGLVDQRLVQPIDLFDCGRLAHVDPLHHHTATALQNFNPTLYEEGVVDIDTAFFAAVSCAQAILQREIAHATAQVKGTYLVSESIAAAKKAGQRVMVLYLNVPWGEFVHARAPEMLYVVSPSKRGGWHVNCVPNLPGSFGKRKALPAVWAGQSGDHFIALTGVSDATFCHRERFVAGANSMEGALKLAQLAIDSAD